jgi:ribosomal protein S12 methylthiotransferase accessory factor
VFLWDLGGPLAAIGCAIVEDPNEIAWRPLGCYQGFGAHLVPEVAIARALTEAAQTRLTYIAGGRDDFFPFDYERATDPDVLRDLWERLAAPCEDPVDARDLPRHATHGLGEDLDVLVGLAGGSVIAVDLTLKSLGVPVAKVIVPGKATDVEALG